MGLADLAFEVAQLGHFPELMLQLLDPLLQVGQYVLLILQRLLHTVQLGGKKTTLLSQRRGDVSTWLAAQSLM